ncbi:MAG: DMT family transporter [Gemmataceae bacterium]
MNSYIFLAIAIVAEVIATSALKGADKFTRFWPSMVVIIGYGVAFYCLSNALDFIPVGVAYAIWSGLGIVLVTVAAVYLYRQVPDWPAIMGVVLIVAGVMVINLWSKSVSH